MESGFPEIQARHTRIVLEALGALYPAAVPRVRERLSPLVLQAIDAAFRLDYLPVLVELEVIASIREELGAKGSRQVAREGLRRSLESNLLAGLVSSAIVLFGNTPSGLLKWVGRGYGRVCRDCGELRLEGAGEAHAEVRLVNLPRELNVPSYLEAVGGALEAFFDVCQVKGEVQHDPWPGGARYLLRWTPRGTTPAG